MVDPHQRDAIIRAARDYQAAADETTGWEALVDGFDTLAPTTQVIRVGVDGDLWDACARCTPMTYTGDTPVSDAPPFWEDSTVDNVDRAMPVAFAVEHEGEEFTRTMAEKALPAARARETQALQALTRALTQTQARPEAPVEPPALAA